MLYACVEKLSAHHCSVGHTYFGCQFTNWVFGRRNAQRPSSDLDGRVLLVLPLSRTTSTETCSRRRSWGERQTGRQTDRERERDILGGKIVIIIIKKGAYSFDTRASLPKPRSISQISYRPPSYTHIYMYICI